jgi:hypothetical protein
MTARHARDQLCDALRSEPDAQGVQQLATEPSASSQIAAIRVASDRNARRTLKLTAVSVTELLFAIHA